MRTSFVHLLRKSGPQSKIASRLGLNLCWCRLTSEACKYKKYNYNGGHDDFLLSNYIGCKTHTADLALIASRFSQLFSQESLTSKWWLSSKVEAWNFTKNKVLKLVNSMKMDFVFTGLNLNIIIHKKKFQKSHILWMTL